MLNSLRIAIVCDWLTVYAGAERVVYEMHQLFPEAPIFTSLYKLEACPLFNKADVRESALRFFPFSREFHPLYFPFMPKAFERIDLSSYDLVLSSSHSAGKGVITKPETLHVSYCHSPMRYVWDRSHVYQKQYRPFLPFRIFYKPLLHRIRMWDRVAAERVDLFLANSKYIQSRIQKYYGRESTVIYPPVDLHHFTQTSERGENYLAVGRLIPYKQFDLLIEACNKLKRPLQIVGDGP